MLETATGERNQTKRPAGHNRARPELTPARLRSALTNGSVLIAGADHNSAWLRRYRDLLWQHEADLGGEENLSEGQRALVRRATMIELQLEMMENKFADNEGKASVPELESYQRATNTLRRLFETLGLNNGRKARDVTPAAGMNAATRAIVDAIRERANAPV